MEKRRHRLRFIGVGRGRQSWDEECEVAEGDGDALAAAAHSAIRRRKALASRHIEVELFDDGEGSVWAGAQRVGSIQWEAL